MSTFACSHCRRSLGAAHRTAAELLYGADSVYARRPTLAGVASMQRRDLLEFVARWESACPSRPAPCHASMLGQTLAGGGPPSCQTASAA
jgi:hypothetical protein